MSWDAAWMKLLTASSKLLLTWVEAIMPCSYLGHEGLLNGLTVGDALFNRLVLPLANAPSASPAPALPT